MTDNWAIVPVELSAGNLLLRSPLDADAADALLMLQDPQVDQWHPAPAVVDIESAQDWCRRGADWSRGEHATFAIIDTATERLVGNISLGDIDQVEQRAAAVAYRVAPWARRQGVASGAVELVTVWAFDQLRIERIKLEHSVGNEASCLVAQRARYALEGVMRQGHRDERGVRHDAHLHARLISD
ncbi:MAG TPA: GNAT family protein [Actinomycetes bacterium]|nr:GNAT family protein [Actinomycetes bacterium]